ncbi:MAG: UbiX family flavin prenyltransferase [Algisphaera sp.]
MPAPLPNTSSSPRRIVVGITGASGALYAARLVQLLVAANIETHLIVSALGQRLLRDELGLERVDLAALAGTSNDPPNLMVHHAKDVGATVASGSFQHNGMIVCPCSSNTLAAIASGNAQHLIHRAAHVALKERRKLVLVHREMPLSLIDIRNMAAVTEAGAIVAPANPGFYKRPQTLEALADFVVGRCLDLLDVPHDLDIRWSGAVTKR